MQLESQSGRNYSGTFSKGSWMSREDELAQVRDQVSILAEQVARLLDVVRVESDRGRDTQPAEDKLVLLESLMWKLHRRHTRLKAANAAAVSASL
jgi:hypothetical protein